MVSTLYQREYGEAMPFAAQNIIDTYGGVRKGNYERMRDGVSIPREYHPLFGDTSEDGEPIAIVYAYWGSNQKAKRRLIKIGYTSQDLATYLRNLQRAYDPRLMATRCGGRHEEDIEHALYRLSLAEGREWFYPTPAMFDTFRRVWDVTPEFDIIAEEALSLRY